MVYQSAWSIDEIFPESLFVRPTAGSRGGHTHDLPKPSRRPNGEIVRSGQLGTIIQVTAEKSYPWTEHRPQDEAVDGG